MALSRVEASTWIPVEPELAFAVAQTTGELRQRWDVFTKRQLHLHGATGPAVGVQTETVSRHGFTMVSEYVSVKAPDRVGMKMVKGPWFFESFGGGWVFASQDGGTHATWRYTFKIKPAFLAPLAERIGMRVLQRDIEARIAAFAEACVDPEIVVEVKPN